MYDPPVRPPLDLLLAQASEIFRDFWLPQLLVHDSRRNSPPEDALAFLLPVSLFPFIRREELEVTRHHKVRHRAFSSATNTYELDIRIRQVATGAELMIEINSWKHHASSADKYTCDLRRLRELFCSDHFTVAFSTDEVCQNPWLCVQRVHSILTDPPAMSRLTPISLPPELCARVDALVNSMQPHALGAADPAGASVATGIHLQREIADLLRSLATAVASPRYEDERREHPRAYEPWDNREIELLQRASAAGWTLPQMASAFQRQPGAIESRLSRLSTGMACNARTAA